MFLHAKKNTVVAAIAAIETLDFMGNYLMCTGGCVLLPTAYAPTNVPHKNKKINNRK
jgi:hypothetical protein